MTSEQRQSYARQVWQAFKEHSLPSPQNTLDLASPLDWYLIASWMDRGIPLRIVLRAFKDTKGPARTLLYYSGPVEEAYRYWLRALSTG